VFFFVVVVIVSVIGLGWFVILLYVDVVVLLVDIGLIYMMMMLCIFYVMVCNGNVLEFLVCINCSGVLWISLFVLFVVGLVIFLLFLSW